MRVRQGKKEIDLLPSAQGNAFDAKQDNSMSNCLKVQIFHNRKGKHVVIVRYDISFWQTANSHNHPIFEDNNFLALFIWLHLDSPNESPTEVLLDVARAIRADRNWGTVYLCYISVSRGWNPPTHTHTHKHTLTLTRTTKCSRSLAASKRMPKHVWKFVLKWVAHTVLNMGCQ